MTEETREALRDIYNRISFMFHEKCEEYDNGLRGSGSNEAWGNIYYREALLDVQDMIDTYISIEG